jgi:glycolate oxidase
VSASSAAAARARDVARRVSDATVVVTDADVLEAYRRDRAPWAPAGRSAMLVAPAGADDVRHLLAYAAEAAIPVVPRGAGSGLSGGANAVEDGIVLSLHRMNAVTSLRPEDRLLTAQPGTLNAAVKSAAASAGLWYPPDPASSAFCSIGGNVATNAGGLCCVKYGVTREWVQHLEAVLPGGELLRTGHLSRKGVAGYDLVGLLTGSEGTLAVVTEVTVRLRPPAGAPATVIATFADLPAAGAAIEAILSAGEVPSLLEIVDRTTLRAVQALTPMDLEPSTAALLVAQYDGDPGLGGAGAAEATCSAAGATVAYSTCDPAEAELLLAARKLAYPALEALGIPLLDDVAVPPSAVTTLLAEVEAEAARHSVVVGTFGHAGDGNLHPTIVVPRDDPAAEARAHAAFEQIVERALSLGGTITGEHGVGLLKADLLHQELDPVSRRVHADLKRVFDPEGILNPGKAQPAASRPAAGRG